MNYKYLEKVLCDTIKEEQIKLGYAKETLRLYYPMKSLCFLLGEEELSHEQLQIALSTFASHVKGRLGEIQCSNRGDRYCILIPPTGVEYVHLHVDENPFLIEFIEMVRNHSCSLEQILNLFHKYYRDVVCDSSNIDDFDYVIYVKDSLQDDYRYCIKFEHGHTTYHRFTKKDFEHLLLS